MLARSWGAIVSLVALVSIGAGSSATAQVRLSPAQQIAPPTPAPRAQPQTTEPPSGPFFIVPKQQREAVKPKVVCGMTVIPADPSIDPKFVIRRPDTATTYTIRTVQPAICR